MRKVSENDCYQYISWAENNTANRVYPRSIAEGFQPGDIYVNDGSCPESVFFWHYCGFGYISGKASAEIMNDICAEMISGRSGRRLVLITSDEEVISFFRKKDVLTDSRAEYSYHQKCAVGTIDSDRFRIERIDAENISEIRGRIIPSFSWESPERFLKEGFGYAALDRGKVCAAAFSAAVSSDEIDIGVETLEEYRGKGLASALVNRMCEHIAGIGKKPVWAHSISNEVSVNTALKCGFVRDRINTVIRKRDTAG